MKKVIITQARVSSTRLPRKVLMKIGDETILDIHLNRLKKCSVDAVVVAVADEDGASDLIKVIQKHSLDYHLGPVHDVLSRFYLAARNSQADIVVRVTSDCPLVDSDIINKIVELNISSDADYTSNVHPRSFAKGLDAEVFKISALVKAYNMATTQFDREHVTPYIWRNSSEFKCNNFSNGKDQSELNFSVDTIEDFQRVEKLIKSLGTEKKGLEYSEFLAREK